MGTPRVLSVTCDTSAHDIHALADGELDDDTAADLRGHVARCPSCRDRWRSLIDVRRLLAAATLRPATMPPALINALTRVTAPPLAGSG